MTMSWVTIDRICAEERQAGGELGRMVADSERPLGTDAALLGDDELLAKLCGFGIDVDHDGLERLCEGALSAQEVAEPLIASLDRSVTEQMQGDWVWICVVTLWRRWWPDRVCLELVDDKIQAGYHALEHDDATAAAGWLDAWSDALRLCDAVGIGSIEEFDDRFPMTQSLYNWSQDLQDTLWNAGLDDAEMLRARIGVCEQALRRFPDEDQLMMQNRRRALAESHFAVGEADTAEELFGSWLAADPQWGFGWIGWASCYQPRPGVAGDRRREEKLLLRGYSTPGVRDRDSIADRLRLLYEETARPSQAREFRSQARKLGRQASSMSVSRAVDLSEWGERGTVLRDAVTTSFDGEGLPLDQLPALLRAAKHRVSGRPARAVKIGRNAPCPCGSRRKFKKCCGAPQPTASSGEHAADDGHG